MNKTDEYSQLRAAFAAGCRIQAWHLLPGATNSTQGQWDTLWPTDEPAFTCPAHLYRIHPDDLALLPTEPVADDVVTRTADHIERSVEYIEKVYPDAKMLDRAPILRNMRRWARQLRNTTPTEPAPDREDAERLDRWSEIAREGTDSDWQMEQSHIRRWFAARQEQAS